MLHDRSPQIEDVQILHNYLKHRENVVVASTTFTRLGIRDGTFQSDKNSFAKYDGVKQHGE